MSYWKQISFFTMTLYVKYQGQYKAPVTFRQWYTVGHSKELNSKCELATKQHCGADFMAMILVAQLDYDIKILISMFNQK